MPPIEPENEVSVKICFGGSQVRPPSIDRAKNVCDLNEREWMAPWSEACVLPPGVRIRSHVAYTRFESCGSAVIDSLSRPFVLSAVTSIGSLQESPPVVD